MVWNLGEDDYIGHPPRSKSGGWKFSPKCALRVKMFNFDAVKCLKMVKIAHMWMAVFYQIRWIKNIDQLVRGKHVFLGIWKFITPKFVSVFPFIISNRPTFSEGRGVQTSLGIQICPSPPPYVFLNTPKFADILRFFFIQKKWKLCFWKKVTTHWFTKMKVWEGVIHLPEGWKWDRVPRHIPSILFSPGPSTPETFCI